MARFLIVEDEAVIAMMMELWLADLGHTSIGPATNIPMALDMIANNDIDAAILDLSLGENRSYAIADALSDKHVPFAWGTGYSRKDIETSYRDVPILSKPYDQDEFTNAVADLIAKKSAQPSS